MTAKILALLLLSANLASADDRAKPADTLETAIAREHDAATRERYNAQLMTIAERDIVTAQITRDTALREWNAAVREHRSADADGWAKRHATALSGERDARARAAYHAIERDQARADFEASADRVRRLDARKLSLTERAGGATPELR